MSQLILRFQGFYFEAKGNSAYLLWYLLDYKIYGERVMIPSKDLDKVLNLLEFYSIHTCVCIKGNKIVYHKDWNRFDEFLLEAKYHYGMYLKRMYIKDQLDFINEDTLEKVWECLSKE